VHWRGDAK